MGVASPVFVVLCGFLYSLGQMPGTEVAHHAQNALALFTRFVLVVTLLGAGVGSVMFLQVEDERSLYRFLGYIAVAAPIFWGVHVGCGRRLPQAAKPRRRRPGRAREWWERRGG